MKHPGIQLCIAIGLVCLTGCGSAPQYDGDQRVSVSGDVIVNGMPAQGASVSFVPIDITKRPAVGFVRQNGHYVISEGKGPNVGKYKVSISWPEEGTEPNKVGPERLPPKYNTATELEIDITTDKDTHDFALVVD